MVKHFEMVASGVFHYTYGFLKATLTFVLDNSCRDMICEGRVYPLDASSKSLPPPSAVMTSPKCLQPLPNVPWGSRNKINTHWKSQFQINTLKWETLASSPDSQHTPLKHTVIERKACFLFQGEQTVMSSRQEGDNQEKKKQYIAPSILYASSF